jgi:MFS family permease
MPISHAMVASEVDPKHRGLAQGVAQNLGSNLLGSFAAPALLTWVAVAYGWRNAFYFAAIPGLLSALLIWFLLVEPANLQRAEKQKKRFGQVASEWWDATSAAMKVRNMWICVVVGVLMVAHFVITWTFLQTFLIQQRGMAEIPAGILMSSLGIAAAIYSFVVSGLSDRIGRKPVMVFLPFLSLVGPLGVLFLDPAAFTGEGMFGLSAYATVLIPIFFIGWMVNGTFPIFMATIPSETFKPIHHATVLGLAMGFCEVLGGVFGPPIAGALNDAFGMETFLYVLMILAVISGIVATGLVETAPAVLRRRGQVYATA